MSAEKQSNNGRAEIRRTSAAEDSGQCERLVLSERDWETFFDALVHPSEPCQALKDAFAVHERLVKNK